MNEKVEKQEKSSIKIKQILKILSFLCIVFVFCPSFLVSCSGQDVKVSVMTAVRGVSVYGEKIVPPNPVMLLLLIIPVVSIAVLISEKFSEKKAASVIAGSAAADLILWIFFRGIVKKIAAENYCTFRTTGWYLINILAILLLFSVSMLVRIGTLNMETDLLAAATGKEGNGIWKQMSSAVNQSVNIKTKKNAIGFCSRCGNPISYGSRFCTSCGTPIPEDMLAEAEEKKREEDVKRKTKIDNSEEKQEQ